MTTIPLSELDSVVGTTVGRSEPVTVTQDMVNAFADATYDHQWIHVDPERAEKGPFGGPIAHGFLTLSLIAHFSAQVMRVTGIGMAVNYGLNRVRFPSPVPVGSRVAADVMVKEVTSLDGNAKQVVTEYTISVEGASKPACVAEMVARYYPET